MQDSDWEKAIGSPRNKAPGPPWHGPAFSLRALTTPEPAPD